MENLNVLIGTGDGNEFASCDLLMARCKDVLGVRMCTVGQ